MSVFVLNSKTKEDEKNRFANRGLRNEQRATRAPTTIKKNGENVTKLLKNPLKLSWNQVSRVS